MYRTALGRAVTYEDFIDALPYLLGALDKEAWSLVAKDIGAHSGGGDLGDNVRVKCKGRLAKTCNFASTDKNALSHEQPDIIPITFDTDKGAVTIVPRKEVTVVKQLHERARAMLITQAEKVGCDDA